MELMKYPGMKFADGQRSSTITSSTSSTAGFDPAGVVSSTTSTYTPLSPGISQISIDIYINLYITSRIHQHNGTGRRVARKAGAGTWKLNGSEQVVTGKSGRVIGHVTHLCCIKDKEKVSSNWVTDEYTLAGDHGSKFKSWAIFRIKLNARTQKRNKKQKVQEIKEEARA